MKTNKSVAASSSKELHSALFPGLAGRALEAILPMLTHAAAVVPINVVNCEAPWLIGEPGGLASSHHNHLQYHHFSTHNMAQQNTSQHTT